MGIITLPIFAAQLRSHFSLTYVMLMLAAISLLCSVSAGLFSPLATETLHLTPVRKRRKHSVRKIVEVSILTCAFHDIQQPKHTCKYLRQERRGKILRNWYDFKDFLKLIFNCRIMDNIYLICYSFGVLTFNMGVQVSVQYTPARALSVGIPKQDAAYLSAIVGVAGTVGRITAGLLASLPCVNKGINRIHLLAVYLFLTGVSQCLSLMFNSFSTLAIASSILGFTYGMLANVTGLL